MKKLLIRIALILLALSGFFVVPFYGWWTHTEVFTRDVFGFFALIITGTFGAISFRIAEMIYSLLEVGK